MKVWSRIWLSSQKNFSIIFSPKFPKNSKKLKFPRTWKSEKKSLLTTSLFNKVDQKNFLGELKSFSPDPINVSRGIVFLLIICRELKKISRLIVFKWSKNSFTTRCRNDSMCCCKWKYWKFSLFWKYSKTKFMGLCR